MKYIEVDPMNASWYFWYDHIKIPKILNYIFIVRLAYLLKGYNAFYGEKKIIRYRFWKWNSK